MDRKPRWKPSRDPRVDHRAVVIGDVIGDVIDDVRQSPTPVLRVPREWRPEFALTQARPRSNGLDPHHRTVDDINENDLATIEWSDPDTYTWPDT